MSKKNVLQSRAPGNGNTPSKSKAQGRTYHGRLGTQCAGKRRYRTIDKAEAGVIQVKEKYGSEQQYYYCGICLGYHLSRKKF